MKYLVTGGCGFIGTYIVRRLLSDGHNVTILDDLSTGLRTNCPQDATLQVGDIRTPSDVSRAMEGVDGVFHLAAIASVDRCNNEWADTHRVNVAGTVEIFSAIKSSGARIPVVYASSAATYGNNASLPLSEDSETIPLTSYGLDKLSCEHYGRIAFEIHNIPNVALRLFNVFGPGQSPSSPYSGVITKFMSCVKDGKPLTIFGDGSQTRDFVYVSDIAELFIAAMQLPDKRHRVLNGCTGRQISLNELVRVIEAYLGKPIEVRYDAPRIGDIQHSCGNPRQAYEALGFEAKTTFSEGLALTMRHYGIEGHA